MTTRRILLLAVVGALVFMTALIWVLGTLLNVCTSPLGCA